MVDVQTKVLLSFDLEYCDDVVGVKSLADRLEKYNALQGSLKFIQAQKIQKNKGIVFVTGRFCKNNKLLVKKLNNIGFEIGSHSNNHMDVSSINLREFKNDTNESIKIISDTICKPVKSYRAPGFTIPLSKSFYDILESLGICYDYSQIIKWRDFHTKNFNKLPFLESTGIKIFPNFVKNKSIIYRPGGGNFRISNPKRMLRILRSFDCQIIYLHPRDLLNFYIARNFLQRMSLQQFIFNACSIGNNFRKLTKIINSDLIKFITVEEHRNFYY